MQDNLGHQSVDHMKEREMWSFILFQDIWSSDPWQLKVGGGGGGGGSGLENMGQSHHSHDVTNKWIFFYKHF